MKKRRRLSWRTRRAQCRAIDITHVDRMPVIQLISLYPHYAVSHYCLVNKHAQQLSWDSPFIETRLSM